MPEEIFDQNRPRSAKARRLADAFAGCEEWILAPPSRRREDLDVAPWLSGAGKRRDRAPRRAPESRAA